jgi:RNA polymerase sigma factor (sigma-70 family)
MENKYDSLATYLMLSKKIINKFAPKFILNQMLNDEDAISDVATAIMNADKNFDPDRGTSPDRRKTKYSYRNQCGLWAIKTYITKNYKNKKLSSLDFSSDKDNSAFYSTIPDHKNKNPIDILIENESENNRYNDIQYLINSDLLTDKQKEQIKMYYFENKSLAEIGKIYGVTREAIRQSIKRALNTIKVLI